MSEKCIFCEPDPEALVFSGKDGIVLVDYPCRPGHVIVGIREHRPNLHDVDPDEAAAMMRLAIAAAKRIVQITGAEKTYVVAVGDKDKHFHVHLIPKMASDPSIGPNVFSEDKGWASFLPPKVDEAEMKLITDELANSLGHE